MLAIQESFAYKDIKSVTLDKAELTQKTFGQILASPKFDVPGSGGLKWWVHVHPAGATPADKDNISMFIYVNKSVKAKIRFLIDGSTIQRVTTYEFPDPPLGWGWCKFASHKQLQSSFRDDKLSITCIVEFDIHTQLQQPSNAVPLNYQLFRHVPTDVELVVGSDKVPAHKGFLTLISPVFHAMFSSDTVESKLDKVDIDDFDLESVKSAIDYCYGREMKHLSVEAAVNVLRFCDKYFITAAIEELEKLPILIPSTKNFYRVVRYAYHCNRDVLLADCCKFFKSHQDKVKNLTEFADLPPTLVVELLKRAFDLKTNFDVLTHAYENGIGFVVDHLEAPLIKSMSMNDFCPAVKYAWKCSRDNLKQVCAEFFINNREAVTDSEDFINLPPETMREVLKAAHALKRGVV